MGVQSISATISCGLNEAEVSLLAEFPMMFLSLSFLSQFFTAALVVSPVHKFLTSLIQYF
jgi:hypothetical protein